MIIRCVWEHNGNDTLLYAENFIGAFTRGATKEIAQDKMENEIRSYLKWRGICASELLTPQIIEEKQSALKISDADTDIIFASERGSLSKSEYLELKSLAIKSAKDFLTLYESIPDKNTTCLQNRQTFYGNIPRTANEMYEHTKNVNSYYWGEIGVCADNDGTIFDCRNRGFELLECKSDFLRNKIYNGSYDEQWSLKKVLRRFIWHDRIHAKAMYRMAVKSFGANRVANIFQFEDQFNEKEHNYCNTI